MEHLRTLLAGSLSLILVSCGAKGHTADTTAHRLLRADGDVLLEERGALAEGDLRMGGGFVDRFEVPVRAGESVTFELTSTEFDPVLEVTAPGASPRVNDDWQGDRNTSRVDLVSASAGVVKVRVSSYAPSASGHYRLHVQRLVETPASEGSARSARSVPAARVVALLAAGASLQGELMEGDATLRDGRFYDQINLQVSAASITFRVDTLDGPSPELEVVDPRGRALQAGDDGSFVLVEPGVHRAIVVAAASGQGARYRASAAVANAASSVQPALARSDHRSPGDLPSVPVTIGRRVPGELAPGDHALPSGELADVYQFQAQAGAQVTFELRSQAFDTYLMVLGPDGRRWENDDTQGGTNSALSLTLPQPGSYRVVATSYRQGQTGAYELKVASAGRAPLATEVTQVANTLSQRPSPASTAHRVGELGDSDSQLRSGEYVDRFNFVWQQGQHVRIAATSSDFDTYLILRDPAGTQRDNDDAQQGNTNSVLEWDVQQSGPHTIMVTSYRPSEVGQYQLEVSTPGAVGATAPDAVVTHVASAQGETRSGSLESSDRRLGSGEYVDTQEFTWPAGRSVHLEARSSEFDTYLIVQPPQGEQQENDDQAPQNTNAALDLVTTVAGTYRVLVTSYRPGEQGAYQLIVASPDASNNTSPTSAQNTAAQNTAASPSAGDVRELSVGQQLTGTLSEGDPTLQSGEFTNRYSVRLPTGQSLRLTLDSTDFDTFLMLESPSGRRVENDDVTASNRNSALDIPRAEGGIYTITVTSYAPHQAGSYQVRLAAATPIAGPSTASFDASVRGGTGQGGRVFGVFAGISDYPGDANDLPECANDAIKLSETLTQQGLLSPERQILLTDGEVTRDSLRRAMQTMSQRVGPNDVFIFFYSGHGGRHEDVQSADPREVDGHDEYIYLTDGELLDDEMGRLFDGIHAQTALLALDSCYSGGFAKDVITRPGRVGLFSSEEDVTSAVASAFQAGGYLSYFLRTALAGQADRDPRDGVLTLGEVTHYLSVQFGQNVSDVRGTGGYQQLVIDRGAVGTDQVLWALH